MKIKPPPYFGNFIFTENDIGLYFTADIWDKYNENLKVGDLPVEGDRKIPFELHSIYYTENGWLKFGNKLPLRDVSEAVTGIGGFFRDSYEFNNRLVDFVRFERELIRINFHKIKFKGINFDGKLFNGCNFSYSKLRYCSFENSEMQNCDFESADLRGSVFSRAKMAGVSLLEAKFDTGALELSQIKSLVIADPYFDLFDFAAVRGSITELKNHRRYLSWWHTPALPFWRYWIFGGWRELDFYEINEKDEKVPNRTVYEGVNGIYFAENESVSFFASKKEADSMQGESLAVVLENLKRARWMLGFSFLLLGIFLWFVVFGGAIGINDATQLSQDDFFLRSWVWPLVNSLMLVLVAQNLKTALDNARNLRTRNEVSEVAAFPFALSHYNRPPWRERDFYKKGENRWTRKWLERWGTFIARGLTRFFYCWHPIVSTLTLFISAAITSNDFEGYKWIEVVIVFLLCNWVYRLSNGFQKSILFDPNLEDAEAKAEQEKAAKAKEAMEAQIKLAKEVKKLRKLLQKEREEKEKE